MRGNASLLEGPIIENFCLLDSQYLTHLKKPIRDSGNVFEIFVTLTETNIAPEKWWLEVGRRSFPIVARLTFQGRTVKLEGSSKDGAKFRYPC